MHLLPPGDYVRAYLASDDVTTPVALSLVDRNGNARVLGSTERLTITNITINNGATASKVTVFQDKDGGGTLTAGEELYRASLAINGQASFQSSVLALNPGIKPYAVASAASVGTSLVITGIITST